jgi:curved DNA-binding protein CbpA
MKAAATSGTSSSPSTPPAVDTDLSTFKLINEAYSVLGNPTTRREYDADKFSKSMSLRAKNEGFDNIERPTSVYAAGGEWSAMKGTPAAGASATYTSSSSSSPASYDPSDPKGPIFTAEDSRQAFRASMDRASEKLRDSAKTRATLARLTRAKVDIPSQSVSLGRFLMPVAAVALWGVNYLLFMR